MDTRNGSEIAIVGISGRFPGAKNIDEFWQNLQNGIESISFFTDEELLAAGIDPAVLNNPNFVKARGALKDVELFDASFFGFNPTEAEITDPQHRIFLECAWEALENAGYDCETYSGAIGVYAGTGISTYLLRIYTNQDILNSLASRQLAIANDKDYLTTRVSYKLNLTGPSYTVQTACSTSLVAVHLACQSLLAGECDIALSGGVSIGGARTCGYFYQEGGIESPDGHCRAFDAKAQGTVGSEGIGIVVLKRLEDAIADRDTIHAVIKGSAINNDGSNKVSYTAPSIDSQARAIATAHVIAEVEPDTITYIEAHGTGTSLGDPIEVAALTQAFRANTQQKGFCAIGSVKTNIGHLDTAAGVAGLIKTVLALKHQQIPPSLHFETPNPQIDFANSPFYVNNKLSQWQTNGIPRRAGVSSFGIGGTNAHVILEEAPVLEPGRREEGYQLLVLSAKTSTALEIATANLANYFQQKPHLNLADVAYTLGVGRKAFDHRRFLVCRNLDDAVKVLKSPDNSQVFTHYQKPCHRPVVFMFPGQGSQYADMGRELYENQPIFREQVDYCAELLKPHLGLDLRSVLYPNATPTPELTQTAIAQPALFVIEYALAQLWMSWGVHPEAMIGHSIGEYVAATLAGVFTLEDALAAIATRARLMQQLPQGAMLSVRLGESEVQSLLGAELSLAGSNTPSACIVSGATEAIDKLEQELQQKGIGCRRLHTSHAFHSQMMDSIITPFTEQLRKVNLNSPQIAFISNVSGTWITTAEATDPNYWAKHLRQTVRFSDGIAELLKQPERILLEVGPGRTLSTFAKQHQKAELVTLTSLRHPQEQQSDVTFLFNSVGRLWLFGVKVDWSSFYSGEKRVSDRVASQREAFRRNRLPLPTYPFERQRYWIEPQKQAIPAQPTVIEDKKPDIADWFYIPAWKPSLPPPSFALSLKGKPPECFMVFVDECGLGEKMVQQLKLAGQDTIIVKMGQQFHRKSEFSYTINPANRDDYDALFRELRTLNKIPTTIVHLWSITPNPEPESSIELQEQWETCGFYSLLFLAQAIAQQNPSDRCQVTIVSNNMQAVTGSEVLCPEKALIIGPCKVIPLEYPNLNCRSIDIVVPEAATWQQDKLINQLLAELFTPSAEQVVAYRGHHRWLPNFEPVHLDATVIENSLLREQGVYLITGGLGGVGLALAEYLATSVQAKLVLLGRSTFPQRVEWEEWLTNHDSQDNISSKIRKLQSLEAIGAEVMVINADVANIEQMSAALKKVNQRFGQIHGVIHAAAVPGGRVMQLQTQETAANALAPKVKGTRVLHRLFQNTKLDFFILCSSLSAFHGTAAMMDYTAENAFLDAFAHYSTYQNNFTISINWDRWNSLGMATIVEERYKQITGKEAPDRMAAEEGIEAFRRILDSGVLPQIAVSTQDLNTFLESKENATSLPERLLQINQSKSAHPRPNFANAYVTPTNEIERSLADFWQQILSIEQVGIHDNFFELGGDSLFATQLVAQLSKDFQVKVPYQSFFNSPTIAQLAKTISHTLAEQADEEKLAQALAEIEQLSDDEIQKMLIETGGSK
ncbi:MAG: acyltransferase domain-containing protein [Hassallia sp. WJT32-NPBG1]|jgi:acyl transferase domain-containing protein|nr:acyltransferase domain-containing protein [Hassallia sp. WJT32-NPBG1]